MSKVLIVDCGSMGISYDLILKQEGNTTTKIGINKQAYEAIKELELEVAKLKDRIININKAVKLALIPIVPEDEDYQCRKDGCTNDMAMYPEDNTLEYCEPCRHEFCENKIQEVKQ